MSNKNDSFDFEEFAVNAIKSIDAIRSPILFGTSGELNSGANSSPRESRINAFYRALGLPAVLPAESSNKNQEYWDFLGGTRPDESNNGNVHLIDFDTYKDNLNRRQNDYSNSIVEGEIITFLDYNKQSIKSGIIETSESKRVRGLLFPMVVDGRIHVKPGVKRIAGAFMSEQDRKKHDALYQRPLIEIILYTRFKESGVVDSTKQSEISGDLETESLKKLGNEIFDRFGKTVNTISKVFYKATKNINAVRRKIGMDLVPTVSNIAQSNPKTRSNDKRKGELELQKNSIDAEKQAISSTISMLEFGSENPNNILDGALGDALIRIVSPSKFVSTERKEKDLIRKMDKAKVELKSAFRSLDLLLGTFSGISGTDILVILYAMYSIETKYLVALLNRDAKDRLRDIKGENVVNEASGISVTQAIDILQKKVKEIYENIASDVLVRKHKGKSYNKKDDSKNNQ